MDARSIRGLGRPAASSSSSPAPPASGSLARTLWQRRVPLIITHASLGGFDDDDCGVGGNGQKTEKNAEQGKADKKKMPLFYATSVPRFGYLAQLLPRLTAFFGRPCSSFHYEDVPLRNLPVGLLMDLYRPVTLQPGAGSSHALSSGSVSEPASSSASRTPWRLVVADGEAWHLGDTFLNGAKEADYVRYGSAKQIMSLSKDNTEALWHAVQDNDYTTFARVNGLLLNAPTPLRHVPLRIYIPTTAPPAQTTDNAAAAADGATDQPATPGSYKVMQALVQPRTSHR
ncbi:Autophagy protein 5 [Sporothrix curviconia]|uniref:Autophagy protein 5 n=1 Tax=Sporothrix curviconia TaxID=1260050 RepID=A0ABP0CIN7_9PEZI